jgi:2'-5' RNA ligase
MRIFVALDIEEEIRTRIARFMDGIRGFVPDARWVRPESLHVTLKFVGEKPPEFAEEMKIALAAIKSPSFEIAFRGYGFFPNPNSPRVFWVGIEAGSSLAELAGCVDAALTKLGLEKEEQVYSPHLTLARGGGRSGSPHRQKGDAPNGIFGELQRRLSAMRVPEFGSMTATEFFIYQSHTGRGGSQYTKIERFAMKSPTHKEASQTQ